VSAAARVRLAVGAAALAAGGIVVGVVLATRQDPPQPKAQCRQAPKPFIVPGTSTPATVAAVRAAFAHWPQGTLDRFELLVRSHPNDPVVQFNYGEALICRGYTAEAAQAFAAAKSSGRDTQYEIDADQILHPQYFQNGYPVFEPTGHDPLLLRGAVLQREGHQHSAERLFARAARLRPDDAEAQVAAAVGRFDESNLAASFSRLGPLTRRFPHSQTVRYHLGLLLVWIGSSSQAAREFRLAVALGPRTALGREAAQLLAAIKRGGTGKAKR
jgi:predicted Zn-dependent protease